MIGGASIGAEPVGGHTASGSNVPVEEEPMIVNVNSGNPVVFGSTGNTATVVDVPETSVVRIVRIGGIEFPIDAWGNIILGQTKSNDWIQPTAANTVDANPVTFAIDATGSGTRYDVYSDADLDLVPWAVLVAGDVVNIFYKLTPYNRKFGLRAQGTESNPVIINGVTNIAGQRPQFDFDGAITCPTCNPGDSNNLFHSWQEGGVTRYADALGGIVVLRGPSGFGGYGTYSPSYIEIKNLGLANATNGNTFTTVLDGSTVTYQSSAGLYFMLGDDCLVENCEITNNGFGIFTQAKDGLFSECAKRLTFRNNRVYGNGVSGSWFEHNFYLQCANPVVEGNYIGQVRSGSLGSSYKSRCSGEIFRYNYVEGSAFVCDWVHSEDQGIDGISTQADYHDLFVYGNVFANDYTLPNGGSGRMFHLGGDNLGEDDTGAFTNPADRYREHMYFWGNTCVYRGTAVNNPWRAAFFDLALAANNPNTAQGAPTTVDAWNNAFVVASSGELPSEAVLLEWCGVLNLHGNNLLFGTTILDARSDADSNYYDVNRNGTIINTDPAFSDIANQEYQLTSGSSAYGQATNPASMAAVIAAHPIEYQPNNKTNGLVPRGSVTSLGAYE